MSKKPGQYCAFLLWSFILLIGCSSSATIATTTPTWQMNLTPLLVQPEDVGWPDNSYFEGEVSTPGEISPDAMVGAGIGPDPLPRRNSNVSVFRATQSVWLYADEVEAIQTFHLMVERYELALEVKGLSLELPGLTNSWWFCYHGLYDNHRGDYSRCFVLAQRENILMRGIMPVNGKIITMEDWDRYVTEIHRRLVAYEPDAAAP